MDQPKTDYNPDNYNRDSLANIMQFITADLMIREDIEGAEAFAEFQPQIVKIRRRIEQAYRSPSNNRLKPPATVANVAEGVLHWLREGATVEQVCKASYRELLKRSVRGDRK